MTGQSLSSRVALLWTAFGLVILAVSAGVIAWKAAEGAGSAAVQRIDIGTSDTLTPPTAAPLILKPLSEQDARAENAALPLSTEPLEAAMPFRIGSATAAVIARSAARDCLAAAIYYEAASESEQGQRAVAQVVLNRVRHPAFPSSVCQVVYQGADRETGCQFTFTCNGSLARIPSRLGWERASRIAAEALDGKVEPSVGTATHYHANYVVPYWASSLTKISVIGTHIFYRWRGPWGKRPAFAQAYSGEASSTATIEPVEVLGGLEALDTVELTASSPGPLERATTPEADRIVLRAVLPATGLLKADDALPRLLVDEAKRSVVIDADATGLVN